MVKVGGEVDTLCNKCGMVLAHTVIAMVGSYPPITAPALVLVGAMMLRNVVKIDWSNYSEAVPAFLLMIGIPLTYSIADGLALGFISYPLLKLLAGRPRETSPLVYLLGGLFAARYVFL